MYFLHRGNRRGLNMRRWTQTGSWNQSSRVLTVWPLTWLILSVLFSTETFQLSSFIPAALMNNSDLVWIMTESLHGASGLLLLLNALKYRWGSPSLRCRCLSDWWRLNWSCRAAWAFKTKHWRKCKAASTNQSFVDPGPRFLPSGGF